MIAALLGPLLWLGGVSDEGVGLGAAALAGLALATLSLPQPRTSRPYALVLTCLLLVAAIDLLQLLPLPLGILRSISPRAAEIWSAADLTVGNSARFHTITVDPPATAFKAAMDLIVVGFFVCVGRLSVTPSAQRIAPRAFAAIVVIFCLMAVAHPLFGADRLYGSYVPLDQTEKDPVLAPLLNPNHAAAFAGAGLPLVVGLTIEADEVGTRLVGAMLTALVASVAFLTLSRGGAIVVCLELVAMMVYALVRSPKELRVKRVSTIAIASFISLGIAAWIALRAIVGEAQALSAEKLEIPRRALALSRDFPVAGVGRGAMGTVFAAYQGDNLASDGRFTHVENWPVQLVVDAGIPLSLLLITLGCAAFILAIRRAAVRPTTFAAAVALAGLAIHDLADFATEFLGVRMFAGGILAILVVAPAGAATERNRNRLVGLGPLAAAAVAAVLLVFCWHRSVADDSRAVAKAWREGTLLSQQDFIRRGILRHPAEPYLHLALARTAPHADAGGHYARAIRLGPWRATSHFWFARWMLSSQRTGQAWAEYRETLRLDRRFARPVIEDLLRAAAPVEEFDALGTDAPLLEFASASLEQAGRTTDAARLEERLLHEFAPAITTRERRIARLRLSDPEAARREAQQLVAIAPKHPTGYLLQASLLEAVPAEAILENGLAVVGENTVLLEALVIRRGSRLSSEAVSAELERLRRALVAVGRPLDRVSIALAEVELAHNRPTKALRHLLDAAAVASDPTPHLERAGRLAEELSQWPLAADIWRRLVDLHPNELRYVTAFARAGASASVAAPSAPHPVALP